MVYIAICQSYRVKQILEGTDLKNVIERAHVGETAQIIKITAAQHYDDLKNVSIAKIKVILRKIPVSYMTSTLTNIRMTTLLTLRRTLYSNI